MPAARGLHHRREALDALGDAAVDVPLAEGLARRAEDDDLVGLVQQRGLEALHVWHEHRIAHTRLAPHAAHHRMVVGHLRHPLGTDVARDLDFLQARRVQARDELDLRLACHGLLFVLQAVARADVDDPHSGGVLHRSSPKNLKPSPA